MMAVEKLVKGNLLLEEEELRQWQVEHARRATTEASTGLDIPQLPSRWRPVRGEFITGVNISKLYTGFGKSLINPWRIHHSHLECSGDTSTTARTAHLEQLLRLLLLLRLGTAKQQIWMPFAAIWCVPPFPPAPAFQVSAWLPHWFAAHPNTRLCLFNNRVQPSVNSYRRSAPMQHDSDRRSDLTERFAGLRQLLFTRCCPWCPCRSYEFCREWKNAVCAESSSQPKLTKWVIWCKFLAYFLMSLLSV